MNRLHDQAAPDDGPDHWTDHASLGVGLALAFALLLYAVANWAIKLEEAAYGDETAGYDGAAGYVCQGAATHHLCRDGYRASAKQPVVLWLGNSQLAAVNRPQAGDRSAPAILRDTLAQRGRTLITYQMPNASLDEHLLTTEAIRAEFNPAVVVLPVCYDDIRVTSVRADVSDLLNQDGVRERLSASPLGREIATLSQAHDGGSQQEPVDDPRSIRPRVENALVGWLEAHSPLWAKRATLRGVVAFSIHTLRNKLLGINSQTKRPVPPVLEDARLALLDRWLAEQARQGRQVLIYAPPYRQNVSGPYVEADYARFKARLKALAERHGARFADIDDIVPGPEWGMVTDSLFGFREYDFMHFTGAGHQRLAAAIDAQLRAMGD